MIISAVYPSPLGEIVITADGAALTGLRFTDRRFPDGLPSPGPAPASDVLIRTARWLDLYFAGEQPGFTPPLAPAGTPFRKTVWDAILEIPYGRTVTYGALAARLHTSPRAVGGAAGHNPIWLIIPCHRVVGAGGGLTGYAGGISRKEYLLRLEHAGTE